MKWENQQEAALANAKQLLKHEQDSTELLKLISSKWKLIKIEKKKKKSEIGRKIGGPWQSVKLLISY